MTLRLAAPFALLLFGCSSSETSEPTTTPDPCGLPCRDGVCELEPSGVRISNLSVARGNVVYTREADNVDGCTLERISTESCERATLVRFPSCPVLATTNDRIVWATQGLQTCTLPACMDLHSVSIYGNAFATDGDDVYYNTVQGRVAKCAGARGCVRVGETPVGELGAGKLARLVIDGDDLFAIDENATIRRCAKNDCKTPTVVASRMIAAPTFLAAGTTHLLFEANAESYLCPKTGCGDAPTLFTGEPGIARGTTRIDGAELYFFSRRGLVSCPLTGCQGASREVALGAGKGGSYLPLLVADTHVFYSNIDGGLFRVQKKPK